MGRGGGRRVLARRLVRPRSQQTPVVKRCSRNFGYSVYNDRRYMIPFVRTKFALLAMVEWQSNDRLVYNAVRGEPKPAAAASAAAALLLLLLRRARGFCPLAGCDTAYYPEPNGDMVLGYRTGLFG